VEMAILRLTQPMPVGIDAQPPGVKIAALVQSPVFGGRVKRVDDVAARAVKDARQIVRLGDAVAVVADHVGAAKKGLAALVIEWDDGLHAMLTTEAIAAELEQATRKSGSLLRTSATSTGDGERPYQGRGDLPPEDTAAILGPALIVESVP
jgi:isoquinoline 1-oxidoreductase subunit beta